MRKIIGFYSGHYCGTDSCEAFLVPDYFTDDQILTEMSDWAWELHEKWSERFDDGMEDEGPDYYFEDYDPNKHDMLRAGGGSFEDDF